MKNYPHPIIAREGWNFILLSVLITLLTWYYVNFWLSLPFMLITVFIIQFFRDPVREVCTTKNVILSPADGRVICVEPCFDTYQNTNALKISIFMNVFNVHANRAPVDGEVTNINYIPGKFVNADFDKASTDNERNALIIKLDNNDKITVVQIAGLIARRILCYTKVGSRLSRGERYGFIRFGSRVDIYLPVNYIPLVTIGQKVKATTDIIAEIKV